jgi:hypothetical protein
MDSIQEDIIAKRDTHQERMEDDMNGWREGNKASLQKTEVCLEQKGLEKI